MASFLTDLSILRKLGLQGMAVGLVAIVVGVAASIGLGRLSQIADDLAARDARRVTLALDAESLFNSAAINEKNVILFRDEAKRRGQIDLYDQTIARVGALLNEVDPLIDGPAAKEQLATFRNAVAERRIASHHVFDLALAGKPEEAFEYSVGVAAKSRQVAIKAADELVEGSRRALETARLDAEAVAGQTRWLVILVSGIGFSVVLFGAARLTLSFIVHPLGRMTDAMARLANGDLGIVVEGTDRRDEIGSLARSLAQFRANAEMMKRFEAEIERGAAAQQARSADLRQDIKGFERTVAPLIAAVKQAAADLIGESRGLSSIAARSSDQAVTATDGAAETAGNVQTIAAATEQLSASIDEIAGQLLRAATIAETAVARSGQADATIQSLGEAARNIGGVVEVIGGIAAQTRMLSLNATIEAARAGDAGRGFAVVAAEVKALADQTTGAAERITGQVASMQEASTAAIEAVRSVGATIDEMSGITAGVASAVEEQGAATREISRSVQAAAQGTAKVSGTMQEVSMDAAETGDAARRVLGGAELVGGRTDSLRDEVDGFLDRIRER